MLPGLAEREQTMSYMYEDDQGNEITYAEEMHNYLHATNLFYLEGVTST